MSAVFGIERPLLPTEPVVRRGWMAALLGFGGSTSAETVQIAQTAEGLQVSICDARRALHSVPRDRIRGLPGAANETSRAFFETCVAMVSHGAAGGSPEARMTYFFCDGPLTEPNELCNSMLDYLSFLIAVPKTDQLIFCSYLSKGIAQLIAFAEERVQQKEQKAKKLEQTFIDGARTYAVVSEERRKIQADIDTLEVTHVGLRAQEKALTDSIAYLERNTRKNEERLHGWRIDGTKKGLRDRIKENTQQIAAQTVQLAAVRSQITTGDAQLTSLRTRLVGLNLQLAALDEETKKLGVDITYLKNLIMALQGIIIKYKFLSMDIELIRTSIEAGSLQVEDVAQITASLRGIQQFYIEDSSAALRA